MMPATPPEGLSRRAFLRMLGLGAGVWTMAPAVSLMDRMPTLVSGRPLQVGVMLPSAPYFPNAIEGLVQGMQQVGRETRLKLETVDVKDDTASLLGAAESLLEGGADVLVAMLNPLKVGRFTGLLERYQRPMLVIGAGENAVDPGDMHPLVTYHGLSQWQSAYAGGRWAAASLGRRAVSIASLYDSGYDAVYAFELGFEASGGSMVEALTTGPHTRFEAAFAAVRAAAPDLVYAGYAGLPAREFAAAYRASGLRIPIVTHGLFADSLAQRAGFPVYAAAPWADPGANSAFMRLGVETATLLAQAAAAGDLAAGLRAAAMTERALYLHSLHHGQVAALPAIAEAQVNRQLIDLPYYTGFTNPYLTIA